MDKLPLVSVITPMFNAEKYIAKTIESVLSQRYSQWEMLIVDNCSTDTSKTIVKSFHDSRIKLIELDYNSGGPARPRNVGIKHAQGEYIAFLDSDDIWLPEKLQIQIAKIQNSNFDIVHTYSFAIDTEDKIIGYFNNQKTYTVLKYFIKSSAIIYFSNYININSALMKKDLVIKFREEKHLVAIEDWMYWIENINMRKKVSLIEQYLIHYRIDSNSISNRNSDNTLRKIFCMYAMLLGERKISYFTFICTYIVNFARIGIRKIKMSID